MSDRLILHDLSEENGEPPNQSSNQTQSSVAVTPAPELVDINVETTKDAQLVASSSKAKYRLWLLLAVFTMLAGYIKQDMKSSVTYLLHILSTEGSCIVANL